VQEGKDSADLCYQTSGMCLFLGDFADLIAQISAILIFFGIDQKGVFDFFLENH